MFKDKPMQLWDLRALTVIREMPRSFPAISALVCDVTENNKWNAETKVHNQTSSLIKNSKCAVYKYHIRHIQQM